MIYYQARTGFNLSTVAVVLTPTIRYWDTYDAKDFLLDCAALSTDFLVSVTISNSLFARLVNLSIILILIYFSALDCFERTFCSINAIFLLSMIMAPFEILLDYIFMYPVR